MTDIVERLRNVAVLEWCEPMCVEAADEIERLRLIINTIHPQMRARIARCEAEIEAVQNTPLGAVVAKWQEEWRNMQAQRDEALAKVTDLREALQWFVDNDDTNEGDEPMPEYDGQTWNEINAYWIDGLNRARAALALPHSPV